MGGGEGFGGLASSQAAWPIHEVANVSYSYFGFYFKQKAEEEARQKKEEVSHNGTIVSVVL